MKKINARCLLKLTYLVASLCVMSANVIAVTYDDDVRPNIFASNASKACLDCHTNGGDRTGGLTLGDATLGIDFDTYARATALDGSARRISDRVKVRAVDEDSMPPTATDVPANNLPDLSPTEQTLITNWVAQGAPKAAATATTNNITSRAKTTVTLNATINTNSGVSGGQYYFEYGISTAYEIASNASGNALGVTTRNSTSGTSPTFSLTGLACGTSYNYRVVAKNGNNTKLGGNKAFSTSVCTAPIITAPLSGILTTNEDTTRMFGLNSTNPEGGSLTWSIGSNGGATAKGAYSFVDTMGNPVVSPTGTMVRVKYVPNLNANGLDSDGLITVSESGASGGITNNITINMTITAVNDQPAFNNARNTNAVEGSPYTDTVIITDPDSTFGTGLSMTLVRTDANGPSLPGDMSFGATTGMITWNPSNADSLAASSYAFRLTVSDGNANGTTDITQDYTVALQFTNSPPEISSVAPTMATEDIPYSYPVMVNDPDDFDGQITYTLTNAPDGMAISNSPPNWGEVTWTPLEGILSSNAVTITVEDGNEDLTTPGTDTPLGTETFTVTVTPVNDPPQITSTPDTTPLIEGDMFSYQLTAFDPDDFVIGGQLTASLSGEPTSMSISSSGLVSWTVNRTNVFANTFSNITVTITDDGVGSDDSVDAVQMFTLVTSPPDADSDLVADYVDNCPTDTNGAADASNQADNDNDTAYVSNAGFPAIGDVDPSDVTTGGDVCDIDDDNDGITDVFENAVDFLDAFNAADAADDRDGDGFTNLQEFLNGTNLSFDSAAPEVTPPATLNVNATGYLTMVDIGTATASDVLDGKITSVVAGLNLSVAELLKLADVANPDCGDLSAFSEKPDTLPTGKHKITWLACDSLGNIGRATQEVNVRPIVSIASGSVSGEGQAVSVDVMLNGAAATYPVTVTYQVSGTAAAGSDHDLSISNGSVTFANPSTVQSINFNVVSDAIAESDETVVITLSGATNAVLGSNVVHTLTITDANVAPQVDLAVTQGGNARGPIVYQPDGIVTVMANATDVNGDAVNYNWNSSDAALLAVATINGDNITFDPTALTAGTLHNVEVTVSDGTVGTSINRLLSVKGAVPVVSNAGDDTDGDGVTDGVEGFNDSDGDGIPDFRDHLGTPSNVIESQTGNLSTAQVIETEPGLSIALGATAIAADATGVHVSAQDVIDHGGAAGGLATNAATDYTFTDALFSFEISGLTHAMQSVNVILPLPASIQSGVVYRKYIEATGWADFVEDDLNRISSAAGDNGVCPEPGSAAYTAGLTVQHNCLQLTIQDGGANDGDGLRNFIVKDPGGLALEPINQAAIDAADAAAVADANSSGRAGSLGLVTILLLFMSAMVLVSSRRK